MALDFFSFQAAYLHSFSFHLSQFFRSNVSTFFAESINFIKLFIWITRLIDYCSPHCKSVWEHKEYIKVFGTQMLQYMVASQQIGIFNPLLLVYPKSLFIIGSFWTESIKEALWSIKAVILSLDKDKTWWVALTLPGSVTAVCASRYPSTRHDLFMDPIELFQGMEFIPGCPNINWHWIQDLRRNYPQMSFFDTAWRIVLVITSKSQ